MNGGNRYTATVISSGEEMMTVMIREVYQDPSQVGRRSFPSRGTGRVRPYVSDRVFRREPDDEGAEEETGYTIIGGDDAEIFSEGSSAFEDKTDDDG